MKPIVVVGDKESEDYLDIIARIRQKESMRPKSLAQRFGTKRAEQIKRTNSRILGEKED